MISTILITALPANFTVGILPKNKFLKISNWHMMGIAN